MDDSRTRVPTTRADARQRILDSSYELFSRRGIRSVGVDEVIENAGVAKATLYRHFPSKDDLVLAFLECREQRWSHDLVETGARSRGSTPEEQLLAIFEVFDEWFRREDFEACSFINVLLKGGPPAPRGHGQHASPGEHPVRGSRPRQGSRPARSHLVRALVAHPDEGIHRRGRGRRRRSGAASGIDGPPADRPVPLLVGPPGAPVGAKSLDEGLRPIGVEALADGNGCFEELLLAGVDQAHDRGRPLPPPARPGRSRRSKARTLRS